MVAWALQLGQPSFAAQIRDNALQGPDVSQLTESEIAELVGGDAATAHTVWSAIQGRVPASSETGVGSTVNGARPTGPGTAINAETYPRDVRFKPGFDCYQVCEWMEAQGTCCPCQCACLIGTLHVSMECRLGVHELDGVIGTLRGPMPAMWH